MGPPSLPCLGLPLLPARPFSSAWHSRDSRTEPEANLSPPHSPGKMISLSVLSTLSPRVLMRWQLDRKRNRKGLKDLLLLSFSFKDKCPSDHFPQCYLHGGLCDQWL
ncbi:hypothetical protein EYF80_017607 [Liparis tanakae]|uniref:Uncharacterized protein n=1 Tax=Liparis tanakae TaxID=230148 RepID=A0A4Z2I269_9TELE|nr:hypothetical protein EYF80_017607 [Liparis tanakae]